MHTVKNLVLGGGGLRGIGFLGAINYLNESNLLNDVETFIGTSMGSILAVLLSIGYSSNDLYIFSSNFNFSKLQPLFDIDSLLTNYGLDDGVRAMYIIKQLIKTKINLVDPTFIELYNLTHKKLIISASCVTDQCVNYFDYINNPDMKVLLAIRMSISIPIIFKPVTYQNKLYIDGGMCDNFPIHLVQDALNETIGISIMKNGNTEGKIKNIFNYLSIILDLGIFTKNYNDIEKYKKNVIPIIIPGELLEDFNITKEKITEYYSYGYDCAKKFIDTFYNSNDNISETEKQELNNNFQNAYDKIVQE